MRYETFTALFPFCGLGAGARGFLDAHVELLGRRGEFRAIGGIDSSADACADFEELTGAPSMCADIGCMTVDDLRAFAGQRAPDVVFMSPPCKGFSGLLSKSVSRQPKYQRMNRLVLYWIELMLGAWSDPPGLVLLENVPRIASRGADLLARVRELLGEAGYVFHDQTHDCGELGGLAQHRQRYLLVARHPRRVPPLLYQPPKRRVRGCGEVLGTLPLPEDPAAGPLHRMPRISWLNWVRLALIPAGGDWRDLPGVLDEGQQRRESWKRHAVEAWRQPSGTVSGGGSNAVGAVADPRLNRHWNKYSVAPWRAPARTVIGATRPGSGAPAVADPRLTCAPRSGSYGVCAWDGPARTVIGSARVDNAEAAVADSRPGQWFRGTLGVSAWGSPSGTVTGMAAPSRGEFSVADPRVKRAFDAGYAVLRWQDAARTIAGESSVGCGAYSVADPRVEDLAPGLRQVTDDELEAAAAHPRRPPPFLPVIIAADGTWHRPMTTLELAALQGIPSRVDGEPLELAGRSVSGWRERIGNAVPCPVARVIAEQMIVSLIEAEVDAASLHDGAVWVEPATTEAP